MYSYSFIEKVMTYLSEMVYKMEDRRDFNFYEKKFYASLLDLEHIIDKDYTLRAYILKERAKNDN